MPPGIHLINRLPISPRPVAGSAGWIEPAAGRGELKLWTLGPCSVRQNNVLIRTRRERRRMSSLIFMLERERREGVLSRCSPVL
jgi:hypothetical protein